MEVSNKVTPVTLDEVRAAIEGINPNATNASAVRKALGRGSNDTIQRHLMTLRNELIAQNAVPADASDVPAMPTDAMQVVWSSAYTTAAAKLATRLAILSTERDNALERLSSAEQDIVALIADSDSANEAIAKLQSSIEELKTQGTKAFEEAAETAAAAAKAAEETLKASHAETQTAREETASAVARGVEIQHALDLEKRDRETEKTVLNGTIDRLTNQLAELKSLLAQLTLAK
jgi:hypothetical protein